MSYILCYNDNYYKPSESLEGLFKNLIIQPFEHNLPELARDVRNRRPKYWEDIARILEQGQNNFDELSFDKLSNRYYSPRDKASIYCVHYMPMHLFSSYHIFKNYLPLINDRIVFIDFGCGPLTSGIALWAFAQQHDIIYLGIDSSQVMLDKAQKINEYGPDGWKPFFDKDKFELTCTYDSLTGLLDKYIEHGDRTQIIFNFCYFLASPTLDISNLSNVLIQTMREYNQHKMCSVYQNPDHRSLYGPPRSRLYGKWEKLRTDLPVFRNQVTQSDLETFSYHRLINRSRHSNAEVYYEVLCYE